MLSKISSAFTLIMLAHTLTLPSKYSIASNEIKDTTSNTVNIIGNIEGIPYGTIIYLIRPLLKINKLDTISSFKYNKNFKFFIPKIEVGELYFIKIDTSTFKFKDKKDSYISIYFDGTDIAINCNIESWPHVTFSGSYSSTSYQEIKKNIDSLYQIVKNSNSHSDSTVYEYNKHIYTLLMKYPNTYCTPLLARNMTTFPLSTLEDFYKSLNKNVQKSYTGKLLKERIANIKMQETIQPGAPIPNFKFADVRGDSISIKELASKNSLTLIDFWASWCKPCREEIPSLKTAYNKFKSRGFSIVAISIDKNLDAWKSALNTEKMAWMQGRNLEIGTELFGIKSIPTYILIDSTGNFISFDCANCPNINSFGGSMHGSNLIDFLTTYYNK